MSALTIKNIPFRIGQTMTLRGIPATDCIEFSLNIRHNDKDIALHISSRFQHLDRDNQVVLNSFQEGNWGEWLAGNPFPFKQGEEFTIKITFNPGDFSVALSDDCTLRFPNRCGSNVYNIFNCIGAAHIMSFDIN